MNLEPKTAAISGSFNKFKAEIDMAHEAFRDHNVLVIAPDKGWLYLPKLVGYTGFRPLPSERELSPEQIEREFLKKVKEADFLYVYDEEGYIGVSAGAEIGYALAAGKPIYLKEPIDVIKCGIYELDWIEYFRSLPVMGSPKHPDEIAT